MTQRRNRTTSEGRDLGRELARLADEAEPRARLKWPEMPPRCASCAFRHGPHLANGSPETLMDALKCVVEGHVFECHEPSREGSPCSGWLMLHLASTREVSQAPWPWMQRAEDNAAQHSGRGGEGDGRDGGGSDGAS